MNPAVDAPPANLKETVRGYWESNPLGSLDLADVGTRAYFDGHDALYRNEIPFAMHLFEFDQHAGERVLDVGCGPGWLVRNFARGGARITAVDITATAASLAKRSLRLYGLRGETGVADAENLPFAEGTFDFATSNGVLHHTPDTRRGVEEIYRVLKPGSRAMISVYYRHPLLRKWTFPLTRIVLRVLALRAPGRSKLLSAKSVEEFVGAYDGDGNPLGKAYDFREFRDLLRGFEILSMEVHFFPRRFLPLGHLIPTWLLRILNRHFGTLIYATLRKPAHTNVIAESSAPRI